MLRVYVSVKKKSIQSFLKRWTGQLMSVRISGSCSKCGVLGHYNTSGTCPVAKVDNYLQQAASLAKQQYSVIQSLVGGDALSTWIQERAQLQQCSILLTAQQKRLNTVLDAVEVLISLEPLLTTENSAVLVEMKKQIEKCIEESNHFLCEYVVLKNGLQNYVHHASSSLQSSQLTK